MGFFDIIQRKGGNHVCSAIGIDIEFSRSAAICRRHGVARLELFGSFASERAAGSSDIDLLVTFKPDSGKRLDFVELTFKLEKLFGKSIDRLTRNSVERSPNKYFRRYALAKIVCA